MTALFEQLASFIQWIYDSAQTVLDFVTNALSWLSTEWAIIQTVSNVVMPPALQFVLAFVVAFLVAMLVVKVVVNLL